MGCVRLPAENAAIKRGVDPAGWTYENIATQRASMRRYACSFDWDRTLNTCDPEYYHWNQWFFLQMYERGLAYRKASNVNWCPNCQTVLANEQVVNGRCERCDTLVTKRKLTQWYLRITDYADRLLADMEQLEGKWPDKVLTMQRNWIGRSTGAEVEFAIVGRDEPVTVFTTRPDTLYGATFFVVAADSDLAAELAAGTPAEVEFAEYVERVRATSDIDRLPPIDPRPACTCTARPSTPSMVRRSRSSPATTCWLTTAPARSWPFRARPARLGLRPHVQHPGESRRRVRVGPGGDRCGRGRRRPARQLRTVGRAGHRRSCGSDDRHPSPSAAPDGKRSTTGCATG